MNNLNAINENAKQVRRKFLVEFLATLNGWDLRSSFDKYSWIEDSLLDINW